MDTSRQKNGKSVNDLCVFGYVTVKYLTRSLEFFLFYFTCFLFSLSFLPISMFSFSRPFPRRGGSSARPVLSVPYQRERLLRPFPQDEWKKTILVVWRNISKMESSVSIDQDFFESGFTYEGQEQQNNAQYAGYGNEQQFTGYSQPNQAGNNSPSYYTPQQQQNYFYDYNQYGAYGSSSSEKGNYDISGSMKPRQTSEDYTSFEDEPPLLEGTLATWQIFARFQGPFVQLNILEPHFRGVRIY